MIKNNIFSESWAVIRQHLKFSGFLINIHLKYITKWNLNYYIKICSNILFVHNSVSICKLFYHCYTTVAIRQLVPTTRSTIHPRCKFFHILYCHLFKLNLVLNNRGIRLGGTSLFIPIDQLMYFFAELSFETNEDDKPTKNVSKRSDVWIIGKILPKRIVRTI